MRSVSSFRCSAKAVLALSAVLATLARAEPARAQPSAPPPLAPAFETVRIESSTCSHALVDEVERLLRVELRSTSLGSGEGAPRVILSCSDHVSLIRAVANGHESSRQIDLGHADPALHGRLIALAAAELLRDTASGNTELPPEPEPPPEPTKPLPPPTAEPPPPMLEYPAPPSANRLLLFAKLENFGSSFDPLTGGGIGFSHDIGHLSLGLGPSLATGLRKPSLGEVRVLVADLSLRAAYRFPNRTLPGEIGLGHTLGLARMSATTADRRTIASTVSGIWAGPFAFGTLDIGLTDPLFLELAAQFGVVTFPVRGKVDHDSDIEIAGLWGGVSLGLGLNL